MFRFVLRKILHIVPVLLIVSFATYVMLDLLPGDQVSALIGETAPPEQVELVRSELGLDKPMLQRYGEWLGGVVQLDFGRSFRTNQPVFDAIKDRIPVTLEIAFLALVLALFAAIPVGVYSAYRPGGYIDRATTAGTSGLISSPPFLTALLLIFVFGVQLGVLPVTGWAKFTQDPIQNLRHAILPAVTLATAEFSVFSRVLRADMTATLQEDFILNSRAKGLSTPFILFRHALRPSSISLVTLAGLSLGRLIGGTVIIETIFAVPGLGLLAVTSIFNRDFVVIQGVIVFIAFAYVTVNAFIDVLYAWLDPRVRTTRS